MNKVVVNKSNETVAEFLNNGIINIVQLFESENQDYIKSCEILPIVRLLNPYAVDVSSGIEADRVKDKTKMAEFVAAVRKEDRL